MINPVSWDLINNWEDGFYLTDDLFVGMDRQTLIQVKNNKIIEAYRLTPLSVGKHCL